LNPGKGNNLCREFPIASRKIVSTAENCGRKKVQAVVQELLSQDGTQENVKTAVLLLPYLLSQGLMRMDNGKFARPQVEESKQHFVQDVQQV